MIRRVVVLGAGTMGSQIAAHAANAGLSVLLLDVSREFGQTGLRKAERASPSPLFVSDVLQRIETGDFTNDLARIADADWIVEAVVEDAAIKTALLARVAASRCPGSLITTNTSGLSITALGSGFDEDFRRHWFGTHFFNPPRYLKLLEVIPAPDTDPLALAQFEHFADLILGKGVVRAKDTPNFIANRIGVFAAVEAIRLMRARGITIEEVDRLTGTLIGRPKTATFRTLDMVGLDIFIHVAENGSTEVPEFMQAMVRRGMLGAKTQQGFYKKDGEEILTLDLDTLQYRPARKPNLAGLELVESMDSLSERLQALLKTGSPAAEFVSELLVSTLLYTASVIPEISDDLVAVDRAMRWGFGWQQGPFELWDALGIETTAAAVRRTGREVPPLVQNVLGLTGGGSFYKDRAVFSPVTGSYIPLKTPSGWLVLEDHKIIRENPGARLRDLGEGIACLEFRSKMNTIGGDIISLLMWSLEEINRNFEGLVIGNQGANFSAGANLMLLLMEAVEGNWDEIDNMVRTFQRATQAIRHNPRPVVAAPFGLTLGGGCEFVLASSRVQASAETYIGLVEMGAGLIPAGGGSTEMLRRAAAGSATIRQVFENIAMAKVSTSAEDARRLLYLQPGDGITMNPERLIQDAKAATLQLASRGYQPPPKADLPVYGQAKAAEFKLGIYLMQQAGYISDYDAHLGRKLAHVLCGGDATVPSRAPEQYFLDLEREAFVSLCGEPKTLARIEHLLKRGKPLRN